MRMAIGPFPRIATLPLALAAVVTIAPLAVADDDEQALIEAAVVLATFDRLEQDCAARGGPDARQAARIADWRREQDVDSVRGQVAALLDRPFQRDQVAKGASAVASAVTGKKVSPCAAMVALSRTPDARFSRLRRDEAPKASVAAEPFAPAVDEPATEAASPLESPSGAANDPADVLALIDSFGFTTRATVGVGGLVAMEVVPVVLLRSGDALRDARGLQHPGGLEAHRRAMPKKWTKWRRESGVLQMRDEGGWTALPFQTTYARLPEGLRLDGLFRHLGGAGNVAAGGAQSVAAYTQYRFERDGRVRRDSGAGATASAGDTSVATAATAAGRTGRYRIDGLTLHIRYDDGTEERRVLILDPTPPVKALWLDGVGYVRRGS